MLGQVAEVLRSLQDENRLKLVKDILREASQLKESPEQLRQALDLVQLICEMPFNRLEVLRDIVQGLIRLARLLPKEGLNGLSLKDLLEEMKR